MGNPGRRLLNFVQISIPQESLEFLCIRILRNGWGAKKHHKRFLDLQSVVSVSDFPDVHYGHREEGEWGEDSMYVEDSEAARKVRRVAATMAAEDLRIGIMEEFESEK